MSLIVITLHPFTTHFSLSLSLSKLHPPSVINIVLSLHSDDTLEGRTSKFGGNPSKKGRGMLNLLLKGKHKKLPNYVIGAIASECWCNLVADTPLPEGNVR